MDLLRVTTILWTGFDTYNGYRLWIKYLSYTLAQSRSIAIIVPMSTPEQRKDSFLKEYKALCDKHNFDFVAFPQFVPTGQTGFNVISQMVAFDRKELGEVSPIQKKDIL